MNSYAKPVAGLFNDPNAAVLRIPMFIKNFISSFVSWKFEVKFKSLLGFSFPIYARKNMKLHIHSLTITKFHYFS